MAEKAGTSKPLLPIEVVEALQGTAYAHLQTMKQASKALDYCQASQKFSGSRPQIEAEKHLLIAIQARLAALNEIRRLRRGEESPSEGPLRSLVVNKITLPITAGSLELPSNSVHHFIILFQHNADVQASALVSSENLMRQKGGGSCLEFELDIQFAPVHENFEVAMDIFALTAAKRSASHGKKWVTKKAKAQVKSSRGKEGNSSRKPADPFPGEICSVHPSSFTRLGFLRLNTYTSSGGIIPVTRLPGCSCLEASATVKSRLLEYYELQHRGYLTFLEQKSGKSSPSAPRRWCLLADGALVFWNTSEEEEVKAAVECFNLRRCTTERVSRLPRTECDQGACLRAGHCTASRLPAP